MHYVASLSGGAGSAVATDRAIARYGDVTLWFGDTSWEDDDLYRLLNDLETRWQRPIIRHVDGRTPLQVAEDQHIIPNQKIAPCSFKLKVEPFRKFLLAHPKPVTVLLGLDWSEPHRLAAPKRHYEAIDDVTVDYPLLWQPYEFRPYQDVIRSWGIAVPRLYDMGFPHNNCGGRCVKQGIREWQRLALNFPERFAEVRDWEQAQRAKGDARANYAIARDQSGGTVLPLTLAEIEQRAQPGDDQPSTDDMFACMCSY